MLANHVRVYFDLLKMMIRGVMVDLEIDRHVASILRLEQSMTLPPKSVNIVKVKCQNSIHFSNGETYSISRITEGPFKDNQGITIDESLINMGKNREVPMIVENMGNWEIRLKAGTPIGQLHHVEFDDNLDSVKNEPSHISRMSPAKIDAIYSEGKGDNSEVLEELTYKSTHLGETIQYGGWTGNYQLYGGQFSEGIPLGMRIT